MMLDWVIAFLRNEAVLCIAFAAALASTVAAGSVAGAAGYIDWRVIELLFCLMASVAGMRESGVLARVAQALVAGDRQRRSVCLALVMLPFFASMLVTNDVALLAFVPIAILALEAAGWRDCLVRVVVLLAGFTQNWHSLLIGVDLGGLGTPIASLASLIAFRLYMHTRGARASLFMREFALANLVALAAMCALYAALFVAS